MNQDQSVSILGCGWLGIPLADKLLSMGYEVKGSYRNIDKKEHLIKHQIEPFEIDLNSESPFCLANGFFDTDFLIISIPPGRTDSLIKRYPEIILSVIKMIERFPVKGVVHLSSTSVYPSVGSEVFESEVYQPDKAVGRFLLEAESVLKSELNIPLTILRLAGLIGGDRSPENYLKGKEKIILSEGPVNLIHRDDCIRVIEGIIENNIWMETINVCCDKHPTRREYYQAAANKFEFKLPPFENTGQADYKIVNNQKLKRLLGDQILKVVDPLELFSK